eukprot:TRINITY_DN35375_c0_g1_i2.p6 TRINITY_DN35375_c0_g1~~TRINITY_DN35375_c0_g1_i2.p6  ORF type:complete len:121 (+),score=4.48 TRINITY_DN35375_c0_g1_i2:1464-1826(+)
MVLQVKGYSKYYFLATTILIPVLNVDCDLAQLVVGKLSSVVRILLLKCKYYSLDQNNMLCGGEKTLLNSIKDFWFLVRIDCSNFLHELFTKPIIYALFGTGMCNVHDTQNRLSITMHWQQ